MIEGEVQFKPLSINAGFAGRRFNTPEKEAYETACLLLLPKPPGSPVEGDVELELIFYLKHPKRSDTSNYIKIAEDVLVKKGYIRDDRQVISLIARKEQSDEEGWRFRISTLDWKYANWKN